MVFNVPILYNSPQLTKIKLLIKASSSINKFPMRQTECHIDTWCRDNLKLSLKQTCLLLTQKLKWCQIDDRFVLKFINKKYDDIATMITFGNGKLFGSPILSIALSLGAK